MMNFVASRLNAMKSTLRKFSRDTRGTIIIMLALAMPLLVGFLGLAVDVTNWYLSKREAQTAADAAALAGAYQLYHTNDTGIAYTAAHSGAGNNGFQNGGAQSVTPQSPPSTGGYTGDSTAVEVTIGESQTLYLASIILGSAVNVSTRAVAAAQRQPG